MVLNSQKTEGCEFGEGIANFSHLKICLNSDLREASR